MEDLPDDRPIGYWLQVVNRRLDEVFDAVLLAEGDLRRRHWQVLNMLADRPRTRAAVRRELAPFSDDDGDDISRVVDGLVAGDWCRQDADVVTLTDHGRGRLRQLRTVGHQFRTDVAAGVSEEDHAATLRTLRTLADNLERIAVASAAAPSNEPRA